MAVFCFAGMGLDVAGGHAPYMGALIGVAGLCWANLVGIGCNFELIGWVTVEGHAPYLGVKSIGGDNLYGFKVQVATLHVFSESTKNANYFLFRCTKELAKEYKFVLAFEKSLCKDYISDYFYQVGFKKNICIGLEITE